MTDWEIKTAEGMCLRDYFAGQVLLGISEEFLMQEDKHLGSGGAKSLMADMALIAYRMSDAMLKARTPPAEKQP